jgi:hypothetical protein|tara:strand:- start:58 stop:399 length:342 start_codon:yes stop_codon:yes gene_type:complete
MNLQDNIKEWIKIDNEITSLNSRVKELRDSKKPIQCSIVEYVETENLFDATVKISDGRLKFVQQRQAVQLTLRYVEQCLKEKLADEETVESIMNHIKNSRESRQTTNIKRFYD